MINGGAEQNVEIPVLLSVNYIHLSYWQKHPTESKSGGQSFLYLISAALPFPEILSTESKQMAFMVPEAF